MKSLRNILAAVTLGALLFSSCSDEWDKHYSAKDQVVGNANLVIEDDEVLNYLKSATDYSEIYKLWQETGVIETMESRDQVFTVLTVTNSVYSGEIDDSTYIAKSYISDLAFSPANMKHGQRIMMWNGKYLNIEIDEEGNISFNGCTAVKIIKLNDGYIYEVDAMVFCPKSMIEFIESLSDDYSMFRDSIRVRCVEIFDRENSVPKGVDATGNTVYDTATIRKNYYFYDDRTPDGKKYLDILSESINGTVLIPSNKVIEDSWEFAKARMDKWGLNRSDIPEALPDSVAKQWFFQTAFFNTAYSPEDFETTTDMKSVFSKIWRNGIQKVNTDSRVELSNGVVYFVDYLQTPINILVYRLRERFITYGDLRPEQKEAYYVTDGLKDPSIEEPAKTGVINVGWPGNPAFPTDTCNLLKYTVEDMTRTEPNVYSLDYTAYHYHEENGRAVTIDYLIPPGKYKFHMGFTQNVNHNVRIYINGKEAPNSPILNGKWSSFHYDRNTTPGPWGFNETLAKAAGNEKDAGKYRKSGGDLGVFVFDKEEGTPLQIRIECYSIDANITRNVLELYHWCLVPDATECY